MDQIFILIRLKVFESKAIIMISWTAQEREPLYVHLLEGWSYKLAKQEDNVGKWYQNLCADEDLRFGSKSLGISPMLMSNKKQ